LPLADQITVFLWTLAIGMTAGLCHTIYRVISDTLRLKKVGTFAGDIVFWMILTAISFFVLLRANYGQLRLYVFIGLFLGVFLYTRLLGRHSYVAVRWLFRAAARLAAFLAMLLHYIWKIISFPFRIAFMTVIFPVQLSARFFGRLGNFARKVAGTPLRHIKGKITTLSVRIRRKP